MCLVDQKWLSLNKDYPQPIAKTKFEWKPSFRGKVNKFAAKQANSFIKELRLKNH